ncbi:unnamed protein product, partial [Ascophyllum nodosum]
GGIRVPRLEHPTGWELHGGPKPLKPDRRGPLLPARGPGSPDGGVVGDRGRGGDGVGKGGSGTKTADAVPWLEEHSFKSAQGSYVSIKGSEDRSEEVTAAAWIFIDRPTRDIGTVLGNKMSGCGSDSLGFALYVNEWESDDGKLWLEWGDGANGCQKINSGKQLPMREWVHVGFRIGGHDNEIEANREAALFVNGEQVACTEASRRPGSREDFAIGAFPKGDFSFEGRISAVAVFESVLTGEQVRQIAELANRTKTQRLGDAISESEAKSDNLLVALQLDEAAKTKAIIKDGTEAEQDIPWARASPGVYHGMYEPPKVDDSLKDGIGTSTITEEMRQESDELGRKRAEEVKGAMRHAWSGYEQYAFGADELLPRSKRGKEKWGGMGVTLVDSLDTLWLMDMKDEFWRARDWVRDHLTFKNAGEVSVFETTIRELGGLLSAYDLSKDTVFRDKAKELGDLLLPAFDTQSGIPTPSVNFRTGRGSGGSWNNATPESTESFAVEFRYLSKVTEDPKYANKANKVLDLMSKQNPRDGLYPIFVSSTNAQPIGSQASNTFFRRCVTFGALGDSFYEYLLKVWLQGGQTETTYRKMYDRAMDGMTRVLLKKSDPSGLTYVSDWNGHNNAHKMDHLVCFLAGTLALGAETTDDADRKARDMKTAKALGYTCYQMYKRQKTGLAPEFVNFQQGKDMVVDRKAAYNILRPETAEALFVLHELTGDPIYRQWSYEIFQAFEKHCRLPVAYGSFHNVNNPAEPPEDRMESFFLAETLKYLYLIQNPDHEIDLKKYVFNTEAHPLRIFSELD